MKTITLKEAISLESKGKIRIYNPNHYNSTQPFKLWPEWEEHWIKMEENSP
jgi:hypothetical protein